MIGAIEEIDEFDRCSCEVAVILEGEVNTVLACIIATFLHALDCPIARLLFIYFHVIVACEDPYARRADFYGVVDPFFHVSHGFIAYAFVDVTKIISNCGA